ncbi:clarin-3 [Gouania willdenowi]|uniref:Clarin 3 n=1 Tax=Gouania willdenowi TaxID=441366 RepID=A0A8C5I1Q1_GOUWI|nr:clarin-3 [Gouania willdenowi]
MPSIEKILYFMSSGLVTSISVGLLGFGMSEQWAEATMSCARGGTGFFNGSAVIILDLFNGTLQRNFCPGFGGQEKFEVIPTIIKKEVTPVVLHILMVFLLALCLLFSACSLLLSLYNSVSNPYETYLGPMGVYACSSLSACLSVVVLILFAVNINVTTMAESVVENFVGGVPVDLIDKTTKMKLGYFLVIPYVILSLISIGLIYAYDHAVYTHRREQQRPTEDAPKEIMMY